MALPHGALYDAYASRDPRFDGVFYIGVTSTGIYCRPVCTARTPKAANCRFFDSAEAAERARFRPCLRCRPELAPGLAPVDDAGRIAAQIVHSMNEGTPGGGAGLERLATRFGWSSRQIRRIVTRELGVSPMELVLTRRLLLAKQLLTETALPVTEIAFASGFASVRRFNDAFATRYGMPPSRLRRAGTMNAPPGTQDRFSLLLSYRAPYEWAGILRFLGARAMQGVEHVEHDAYHRTVQLGEHRGWIRVTRDEGRPALRVELPHALAPVLPALLGRLRHLFDLTARPDVINATLGADPLLAPSVGRNPGLRVPGAFDGFELAVRAILGQQVSVKAATTFGGRFAAAFGDPADTPFATLVRTAPSPARIATLTPEQVASIGIVAARARTIVAVAEEVASGRLVLDAGVDVEPTVARLVRLPGIGPWTAQYIAMRALRAPDAFPREDLVLRRQLGDCTPVQAARRSEAWSPWRSYATLHLWESSGVEVAAADDRRESAGAGSATPTTKRRPR
ncbi:MAG: DNA-3-methyladenine glycosylase 2 [Gemmatimonadaceae bacterium]|nr:DNA-3-methyladenine glycosylase 2 [Gemmatimonadaceae bacterium]